MEQRYYYSASIADFINQSPDLILGRLAYQNEFALDPNQRRVWVEQISILICQGFINSNGLLSVAS